MGLPVLHGVAGESADIVNKEGVGIVFEPENPVTLSEGIRQMQESDEQYREMSSLALQVAHRYDRKSLAAQMLDVLEQTVD